MKVDVNPNEITNTDYEKYEKMADRKTGVKTEKSKFVVTQNKDGTTSIERPTAIIDKVELFPNGRGKFLKVVHGHSIPKEKSKKEVNPNRLCMTFIKGNPENITLTVYKNKNRKTGLHFDTTIFAGREFRKLSDDEINDLYFSLGAIRKFKNSVSQFNGDGLRDCDKLLGKNQLSTKYKLITKNLTCRNKKDLGIFNVKYKRLYNKFIKPKIGKSGDGKVSEEAIEAKAINEEELRQELYYGHKEKVDRAIAIK